MNQHRRQEHNRRIEVENSGDYRDEQQAGGEQGYRRSCEALQETPGLLKEAIAIGDQSDHQQPADEHERGPGLFCGSAQIHRRQPARVAHRPPPQCDRGARI